ncbi:MAG: hypothetical protein WAL66_03380 [Nitrososphaeraceae archaeon]
MISVPSLYKWADGAPAFEKLTAIFYRHVLEEPLLRILKQIDGINDNCQQ